MIVLDTNVVSETMRAAPSAAVLAWLDRQQVASLYVTTISVTELRFGVERLPEGQRKATLRNALEFALSHLFSNRILTFDEPAARHAADIFAQAERQGRPVGFADGQIAGIAKAHGFAMATRDTQPFETAGLQVINPWSS